MIIIIRRGREGVVHPGRQHPRNVQRARVLPAAPGHAHGHAASHPVRDVQSQGGGGGGAEWVPRPGLEQGGLSGAGGGGTGTMTT